VTGATDRRAAALRLSSGQVVGGKYRLVRRIGAGGMGEVWVAENRDTDARVAVKTARALPGDPDAAARFRREARLAASLSHRGVVRIFDLVEEPDGSLVIVMELLHGETLERFLQRRGPLPTREAIAVMAPVLAALAHAHLAGIVHRDVTPANVFLAIDPDGLVAPKLLDFGIAKMPAMGGKHTVDGQALGTPRYMAPERIREHDAIDGRTDLFSVAVIIYELLTGVCPFAAPSPAASLAAVLESVVDPDPRIDVRLWLELRRALSKQPYERPPSASAMAEALLVACGETEASLTAVLRQLPLSPEAPDAIRKGPLSDPGASAPARPFATAVRSVFVAPLRRVLVIAGGLSAVTVVAIAAATLRQRAATTTAPAAVGVEPSATATLAMSISTASIASPIVTAIAMPPAPSAEPTPVRPLHKTNRAIHAKPVATTPGF
jgi:serine/threonine-protein kinase